MSVPGNLTLIHESRALESLWQQVWHLSQLHPDTTLAFHFTNGIYSAPAQLIVPTTLAGFGHIRDKVANRKDIFAVGVNSNASMATILAKKNASQQEISDMEDEQVRARKILEPLARDNSDRQVIGILYDSETPTEMYDALAENGLKLASLHKWGYGTDPAAPKIEGAHNFARVFGFPLPNDKKPYCYDITTREDQSHFVEVVDLRSPAAYYAQAMVKNDFRFPPVRLSSGPDGMK